jgi:trimeric autotransporter adhesin
MGLAEQLFGICRNGSRLEMYDVNFGGTKHMTKRLTIALVAVAMFVLLAVMPVSAYTVATNVSQGATVFIGESGLNVTAALATAQTTGGTTSNVIGWWASAASISTTAPTKTIDLTGRTLSFTVASTDFVGYTGNWYLYNGSTGLNQALMFTVADPSLAIAPWDFSLSSGNDMSGKSVVQGQKLGFKIDTNMYSAINNRNQRNPIASSPGLIANGVTYVGPINDGYLDIKVKDPSGTTITSLMNASGSTPGTDATSMPYALSLTRQNVSFQPWYFGTAPSTLNPYAPTQAQSSWATDALDRNGQYYYPPGTYTIYVESQLNGMKDNYKNAGADYTGKTISATTTLTLVSDSIKIEANKDSVVRSKAFSVTITGKPLTSYHMWVKGTSSLDGSYDEQPPMVSQFQAGVVQDSNSASFANSPGRAGNYLYQNGAGKTIWQNVAYPHQQRISLLMALQDL